MPALTIHLLGGMEVTLQGKPLAGLRTRHGLRLLAFLALRHPLRVERRYLAGLLWPHATESGGLALLRRSLTDLRQGLGAEAARITSPSRDTLQLVVDSDVWIDTKVFALALADESRLEEAQQLYRGPLLEGFQDEWILPEREHLRTQLLQALERQIPRLPISQALPLLERVVSLEPLKEPNVQALLTAQAAQGDLAGMKATYQSFQRNLKRWLGTAPDDATVLLYRRLLRARTLNPPQEPVVLALPTTLPRALTRFVGREQERAQLQHFLEIPSYRLITLTGLGGIGKTRLMLEVVPGVVPVFPSGIFYVSVAELTRPGQLDTALAQSVGAASGPESTALLRALQVLKRRESRMLLILDNLEHLLAQDQAPGLRERLLALWQACPLLTCLVTSRQPLQVSGEQELPLLPLEPSSSAALFVDRVRSRRPQWELTPENAALVSALCQRLEGSPLAIELAAGALHGLSLRELLQQLDSPLALASPRPSDLPERHRSMRATLQGSYQLLPPSAQSLFADLSVFRGGAERVALAAVCGESALGEPLSVLLAHALVGFEEREGGRGRYTLLELVREFAQECLHAQGREQALQERHADHFTSLATQGSEGLASVEQEHWHGVFERESANFSAALDNLAAHPTERNTARFLELTAAMARFWERRSYYTEAQRRCQQGLALHGERPHTDASAYALMRMGLHGWRFNDLAQSQAYTRQALAYYEMTDQPHYRCECLQNLGNVSVREGNTDEAQRCFDEGLVQARRSQDPLRIASLLGNLGGLARASGDLTTATRYYEEQLAVRRKMGDLGCVARSLSHFGSIAQEQGDLAGALRYFTESLALHRRFKNQHSMANDLSALAELALGVGEWEMAWSQAREALEIHRSLALPERCVEDLGLLARIAQQSGNLPLAVCLWATMGQETQGVGSPPELTEARRLCTEAFGEALCRESEVAGRLTPLENLQLPAFVNR